MTSPRMLKDDLDAPYRGTLVGDEPGQVPEKSPDWIGFDKSARYVAVLTFPISIISPKMVIFEAPEKQTRSVVTHLAVQVSPPAFLQRVSWVIHIGRGGPSEFQTGSRIEGAAPDLPDSGLRWGSLGCLNEPAPIHPVRLFPKQTFGLEFRWVTNVLATTLQTFTVYARVQGRIYR